MNPATRLLPPLFAWARSRAARLSWLPGFLAISGLAHVGTFFLFSVVYPERATLPPPPPSITVLSAARPENRALLAWIESEDPARIALPPEIEPPGLLKAQYQPSYRVIRTATRALPPSANAGPPPPPARAALAIIRGATEAPAPEALPAPEQKTALSFSGALAGRTVVGAPPLALSRAKAPLEAACFLIGVSERGQVRFCFGQKSSGDALLDAEAEAHLSRLSFEVNPAAITWGVATFEWGDEVHSPPNEPSAVALLP